MDGVDAEASEGIEWTGMTVFTMSSAPLSIAELITESRQSGIPDTLLGDTAQTPNADSPDDAPERSFDLARIDRSKPWDGGAPPITLDGGDPHA